MDDTLTSVLYRVHNDVPQLLIELLLIGLCVNWCASVLQSTRGTRPLRGVLVILIVATVIVRVFGWERLEVLYHYVLVGLAFIALIVFQPELRRALIRVGDVPFQRTRGPQSQLIASLVKSAGYLSKNRYGALIAVQRDVDLMGWAENGTIINAEVSASLLNSIFFPNNPLHDLGVIIRGNRVVAANCQFPSPDSDEVDAALGSRHLAAVGMSYESDALVLVVSEETGVISLADNGRLTRYLTLDDLATELEGRLIRKRGVRTSPTSKKRSPASTFWRYTRRALLVLPLTLVIWYLVDQATLINANVEVLMHLRHEDPGRIVDVIEPRSHVLPGEIARDLVFSARVRGPARAIDELPKVPWELTWVLPDPYAQVGPHVIGTEGFRGLLNSLYEVTKRGITVEQLGFETDLHLHVDELVTRAFPVQVPEGSLPVQVEQVEPPTVEARLRGRDVALLPAEPRVLAPLGDERLRLLPPEEERTFTKVALEPRVGSVKTVGLNPPRVAVTVRRVAGQVRTIHNVVVQPYLSDEIAARYTLEKIEEDEWRIDLNVTGEEARIAALTAADIRAFVHVTPGMAPPEEDTVPMRLAEVTILTPPGVTVVSDRPRTVRIRLVEQAGSTP